MNYLVCDIDHTLTPFKDIAARLRLGQSLVSRVGQKTAQSVSYFVGQCFETNLKVARGDRDLGEKGQEILHLLDTASKQIVKKTPESQNVSLRWSRELYMMAAQSVVGVALSLQLMIEAADAYWRGIAMPTDPRDSRVYPDVIQFFKWLDEHPTPWELILVTGSDRRLYFSDGKLVYAPEYSRQQKWERIPTLLLQKSGNRVFVGDPIGKPDHEFWRRVAETEAWDPLDDSIVVVGDSYRSDICGVKQLEANPDILVYQPPEAKEQGSGRYNITTVLIDRHDHSYPKDEIPEADHLISSFDEMPKILEQIEVGDTDGTG